MVLQRVERNCKVMLCREILDSMIGQRWIIPTNAREPDGPSENGCDAIRSHRNVTDPNERVESTHCDRLWAALIAFARVLQAPVAQAQDIEPRSYSNAPVGVNFVIAGYSYPRGGIAFDPSLPIENEHLTTLAGSSLTPARSIYGASRRSSM